MSKPFFITTAIDYTNGAPHIGHAYEKVLADVLARYHRLKGEEVFYLTGVDQHGQKVQQSAEKQGVAPQQFVDEITAKFIALWEKLDVRYDRWAATTDPLHQECVGQILTRLRDEGQLYKAKQGGYYSVRQEQFLTDKERNEQGEFGPEWGEVEFREEENYYFKLAEHKDWLLALIDAREDFISPSFRRAELRNAVEKLTGDLCVSRPKARLSWGIEFPFDPDFVTYVWFDALVNYLSFAGYDPGRDGTPCRPPGERSEAAGDGASSRADRLAPLAPDGSGVPSLPRFADLWPPLHVIGKDILIPAHGVYWPIMLKALGFTDAQIPPLLVHGWWNISGAKMSKSLGNVIDPDALADKYGAEALRYYLMSDISTGKDADFSEERLVQSYNAALANSLGNLLNRSLSMAAKYRGGALCKCEFGTHVETDTDETGEADDFVTHLDEFDSAKGRVRPWKMKHRTDVEVANFSEAFEHAEINVALFASHEITTRCNELVDQAEPWILSKKEKSGDDAAARNLDAVLYTLAESLRIIAILISPVLPRAAHGIFDQLQWKLDATGQEARFRLADATWGGLPDGHTLGQPTPLFPRIETPAA